MRIGKQLLTIDLTDVNVKEADNYVIGILQDMVKKEQVENNKRILKVRLTLNKINRYGNECQEHTTINIYIKKLMKINVYAEPKNISLMNLCRNFNEYFNIMYLYTRDL